MTSPYRRAQIEWQEEAQDDRTDVQKLHDACRMCLAEASRRDERRASLGLALRRGAVVVPRAALDLSEAKQAADRAFADLVHLINEQFGDEVDVELLAKALAS